MMFGVIGDGLYKEIEKWKKKQCSYQCVFAVSVNFQLTIPFLKCLFFDKVR